MKIGLALEDHLVGGEEDGQRAPAEADGAPKRQVFVDAPRAALHVPAAGGMGKPELQILLVLYPPGYNIVLYNRAVNVL